MEHTENPQEDRTDKTPNELPPNVPPETSSESDPDAPPDTEGFVTCIPKVLPEYLWEDAAATAININPVNAPPAEQLTVSLDASGVEAAPLTPARLAVLTAKYWGPEGVDLTFGFMEQTDVAFRNKFALYANKWGQRANVKFHWTQTDPKVRITRNQEGYWSYLGTDILHIPKNEATMCLQGFMVNTSDREWDRVVTHEVGHTMGFPHEQFLPAVLELLDHEKVIAWMMRQLGWSRQQIIQQVLTPLPAGSYRATKADINGCMMYPFPASVTKNNQAIPGGKGIDEIDHEFCAVIYPKSGGPVEPTEPTDPPSPPIGGKKVTKEQLKAWLVSMITLINGVKGWMWGPLAKIVPYLDTLSGFLKMLSENDVILTIITTLIPASQLKALKVPKAADVAMLTEPSPRVMAAFNKATKENCA